MALRVLVVGGTGFLGQHIVAGLAERGHEVAALARRPGPDGSVLAGDVRTLAADELDRLLAGRDAVVFAAGADARHVPPAPAAVYFERGNVEPLRRVLAAARRAGCRHAVVCGSYFATIARRQPELRLAESHPYIHCRVQQSEAALEAAGPELSVAVLEIPFVFGASEGRRAALAPLAPWLRSRWPLVAPPGGTAVVSVGGIAQAACGALERAATGLFPVAQENLTWAALFARLATAAGRSGPVHVRPLPPVLLHTALLAVGLRHRLSHREPGLNPARLTDLLTRQLYLDPEECRAGLGVTPDSLDRAFEETVAAPPA